MVDVAKALNRPPTCESRLLHFCQMYRFLLLILLFSADPTKFFGCELGAQTQFDTKNDRYIVNGSHEANKLQDMLDGFIKKFVLCAECDNPETDLVTLYCFLQTCFCHFQNRWGGEEFNSAENTPR